MIRILGHLGKPYVHSEIHAYRIDHSGSTCDSGVIPGQMVWCPLSVFWHSCGMR